MRRSPFPPRTTGNKRPVRSVAGLCALHLVGNALLFWVGYYWLGVGESDAAHLAWSALVVIASLCAALWLHGTALVLFERGAGEVGFASAAGTALRHLAPLFLLAVVGAIIYALLGWWHDSFGHRAFVIGSYATMKLRRPVAPSGVLRGFYVFIWLLRWMVVPVILFSLGAGVAVRGWAGFGLGSLRRSARWLYWLEVCALMVCAIWVPLKLVNWIPHTDRFALQVASLVSRLGVAYLLFVVALLVTEFVTSRGRPRAAQLSTVGSP